jgi:hypothetical protein
MPVEQRTTTDPSRPAWTLALALALALAIAGLSGCVSNGLKWTDTRAVSFLRIIQESNDPNVRYAAYDKLSNPNCYDNEEQKKRVAQVLADKLKSSREPVATRAIICRTLGMIGHPVARDAILIAINNDDDPLVKAQACRALGRVGQPEDSTVLARVMATHVNSPECQVAAIESIGDLKPRDKRIAQYLVKGMEHDEPVIRVACLHALRSITGRDLGLEALDWKKYIDTLPDQATAEAKPIAPVPVDAVTTLPRELPEIQ